ncbi:DUF397 domain-containing protein [Saccharopolyspora pogona]|uniref:DUF397 domain-containing protein n=1 Tax=Saccharopolyspora pogona TaxID=333966 RepID=UPI001CC2687A|nr:DUF397 domain-containing protein [Saccharopolyspora pogona]
MRPNPVWKKSSRSGQANACVEVASNLPERTLVRDSKLGDSSPILSMSAAVFESFVNNVKTGKFDA